jgi:hypothetical protein
VRVDNPPFSSGRSPLWYEVTTAPWPIQTSYRLLEPIALVYLDTHGNAPVDDRIVELNA